MGLTRRQVRDRIATACRGIEGAKKVYGTVPAAPITPSFVLRPRIPTRKPGPGFGGGMSTWQFGVLVLVGQIAQDAAQDQLAEWEDLLHTALHGLAVGSGYAQVTSQTMTQIPVGPGVWTTSETALRIYA